MNASEKVSDFQRAAEKTGMQFGIVSMDTLMRMRAEDNSDKGFPVVAK